MQYDPIKRSLGNVFNSTVLMRRIFYKMLDLLLLRAWHIHKELKLFRKNNPSVKSILDAGMGFGQYTWYMAKLFPKADITAVDVKEEQIQDCNRFFEAAGVQQRVKASYADLTEFRQQDAYDLVLCVDVMEHILEDEKVFANYSYSMKKGGMLLISTPSDQGGSDVHADDDTSFIEEHVRDGYNIKDIEDKLLRNGFSKVEARYSYGAPGKIAWRISMKYPILMLGFSKVFFIILPFYYLLVYPVAFVLNYFDVNGHHPSGTGLIVKAYK
jgi:SAM-dependent methyltransferase